MLHLAVATTLAVTVAVILDFRVADATVISSDLDLYQFCTGCAPLLDDTTRTNLDWPLRVEPESLGNTIQDLAARKIHSQLHLGNLDHSRTVEIETDMAKFINVPLGRGIPDLAIPVEYQDRHQENDGCSYSESKLRDPRRVQAECDNVEPGSDRLELLSALTLITISLIAFALLAAIWLLQRFVRNWRLRSMTLRDKPTSDLQGRNSGRRTKRAARALR
jgi:hypothetical protein